MKKLQVGIIGCGLMGSVHAASFAQEKQCRIAGFYNRTRDKAEALATQFGGDVFDSLDDILQADIDAVSITTSQQIHSQQVIAAAHAGKHILCEKPVGLTTAEFEAMQSALEKAGVTFMTAHQLRFHPVTKWVQKKMPRLGRVFHLQLEMPFLIRGHEGRCWEDFRSGGFFMELGCHLADLSRFLMGEVRHVSGHTLRLDPKRATEDFTHCLLQFESGAIGSITVSANHRTRRQGLLQGRVLGERGRIEFSIYPYGRAFNDATLILDGGKSVFVPDETKEKLNTKVFPPSPSKTYPGFFDVYQQEIHAFVRAVQTSTPSPITFDDGRKAVEIVLAAYAHQGHVTDTPNFHNGLISYRADEACHPTLQSTFHKSQKAP